MRKTVEEMQAQSTNVGVKPEYQIKMERIYEAEFTDISPFRVLNLELDY